MDHRFSRKKKHNRTSHPSQRKMMQWPAPLIEVYSKIALSPRANSLQPDNSFKPSPTSEILSRQLLLTLLKHDHFQLNIPPTLRWMPRKMFLCLVSRPVHLGFLYVGRCCCPLESEFRPTRVQRHCYWWWLVCFEKSTELGSVYFWFCEPSDFIFIINYF